MIEHVLLGRLLCQPKQCSTNVQFIVLKIKIQKYRILNNCYPKSIVQTMAIPTIALQQPLFKQWLFKQCPPKTIVQTMAIQTMATKKHC